MSNDDEDLITKIFKGIVLSVIAIGAIASILLVLIVIWWGIERVFNLQTPKEFRYNSIERCVVYANSSHYVPRDVALASLAGESLIDCFIRRESSGDPKAYNPKDVDGRPKYGLLQFDSRTFKHFCVDKYDLSNDIWNPEVQKECCQLMIDNGLAWHWGTLKYCN